MQDGLIAETLEAALTVRDLPASVAWYRDVLGFSIDREHRREGKPVAVPLRAGAVRSCRACPLPIHHLFPARA